MGFPVAGVVGVLANLVQIAMIALTPGAASLGLPEGITLPHSWQWLIDHALSLSVAGVLLSAAFCWLSWAPRSGASGQGLASWRCCW